MRNFRTEILRIGLAEGFGVEALPASATVRRGITPGVVKSADSTFLFLSQSSGAFRKDRSTSSACNSCTSIFPKNSWLHESGKRISLISICGANQQTLLDEIFTSLITKEKSGQIPCDKLSDVSPI